mmetsp:Transcript_11451/g.24347  ORF Transcript_11451/g.24347 Transcript_11451/m.24347 type:complete len:288 (+) Transcript_11451:295-1158(+)
MSPCSSSSRDSAPNVSVGHGSTGLGVLSDFQSTSAFPNLQEGWRTEQARLTGLRLPTMTTPTPFAGRSTSGWWHWNLCSTRGSFPNCIGGQWSLFREDGRPLASSDGVSVEGPVGCRGASDTRLRPCERLRIVLPSTGRFCVTVLDDMGHSMVLSVDPSVTVRELLEPASNAWGQPLTLRPANKHGPPGLDCSMAELGFSLHRSLFGSTMDVVFVNDSESAEKIEVTVKTTSGESFVVRCGRDAQGIVLKRLVQDSCGLVPDRQRLILGGVMVPRQHVRTALPSSPC